MKGIIVAGLGGGSGKSVVAVGLAAWFARAGQKVLPFKKGPDYIDAGWLSLAAGEECYNLDPFLMSEEQLRASYHQRLAAGGEVAIIEGNRGLYDGVDAAGGYSTAELSKLLGLPVLLVVDCTKTTRTVAALVLGCRMLDPEVEICGVVLNRIGSRRHEKIVRSAVETYAKVPVLGAYRRLKRDIFPMRHLGVTPFQEYDGSEQAISDLAQGAEDNLDMAAISKLMAPLAPGEGPARPAAPAQQEKVRIGILRDAAFQFYYPENLAALAANGAEVVEINSLTAQGLPAGLHALYIGGGFPETSARLLADNESFRQAIKEAAERGLPIYAECGGLIYLGEEIILDGEPYPLVGVFPVRFTLEKRPQAHGYTVLTARAGNPFYGEGSRVKGHEFRYSKVAWSGQGEELAFDVERGTGFAEGGDGLVYKNTLALYTHIHAVGTPEWAPNLVAKAREYLQSLSRGG
ncbi:MAG: cobyrinate a,c-diamide synthase [Thermodesulfobacteriota bacterium]